MGTTVPTTMAKRLAVPKGTFHQSALHYETHHESAEEELFDKRNHRCQAEEADRQEDGRPNGGQIVAGIERIEAGPVADESPEADVF